MSSRVAHGTAVGALFAPSISGCTTRRISPADHDHSAAAAPAGASVSYAVQPSGSLPAGATSVAQRLSSSPRHGEWAIIRSGPNDSVRAWVVYPERGTTAPVVVVIHEIFGLSTWIRGVADQLEAVGRYGMSLPAALPRYGVVGFCWGGGTSFAHAVAAPANLSAAVVYYGTSPATTQLTNVKAPVLGLYAGEDARVDATIPAADSALEAMRKVFEPHIFAGARHGFLRAQPDSTGANSRAAAEAWPLTLGWFRKYLGA